MAKFDTCAFCDQAPQSIEDGLFRFGDPRNPQEVPIQIRDCNCPRCGKYGIMTSVDEAVRYGSKSSNLKKISAYIRARQLVSPDDKPLFLGVSERPTLEQTGITSQEAQSGITIQEAVDAFPRRFSERQDAALLNLARMSPNLGTKIRLGDVVYPLLYSVNPDEGSFMLFSLQESKYVEIGKPETIGSGFIWLTPSGWNRIADLEQARAGLKPRQAFVAIWFDPTMNPAWEQGLKPGIEDAGYEPIRIDAKEFLGDIHDEVLAEIRRSRFVVVDLSGERPNVYYEAGFAEGLGIPTIYTCHKDHRLHFDIRQRNVIIWESTEELRSRLSHRIGAIIGPPGA